MANRQVEMAEAAGVEYEKALDKAFGFLERRDRTEHEVCEKLKAAGFSEETTDAVLRKLEDLGYIDDRAYAERYLESLVRKGRGSLRITAEMRKKGLPEDICRNAIEDSYGRQSEVETALAVAERTIGEIPRELWETDRRKAYGKISRRLVGYGFPYEIIGETMERVRRGSEEE